MKNLKLFSLITALGALAVSAPATAHAAAGVLGCRGGGAIMARVKTSAISAPNDTYVWITFARGAYAAQSAGAQALQPGQCAWMDRPLSATEPTQIKQMSPYTTGLQSHMRLSPSGTQVRLTYHFVNPAITEIPGISTNVPPIASTLFDASKYFKFNAHAEGNMLVVDHFFGMSNGL